MSEKYCGWLRNALLAPQFRIPGMSRFSPEITNRQFVSTMASKWCEVDFVHPQYFPLLLFKGNLSVLKYFLFFPSPGGLSTWKTVVPAPEGPGPLKTKSVGGPYKNTMLAEWGATLVRKS